MIEAPGVDVLTDADFEETMLASDLPVLVEFTAGWCAPCRQLAPVLSAVAREEADRLRVVQIDVDSNPETTLRYGVLAMPTLLVLDGGEPVASMVGARSKARLLRELGDVVPGVGASAAPAH